MEEITTDKAPKAVGPYSLAIAIKSDNLIFCSGQVGLDPITNNLVEGIENQTKQTIKNLASVLESAGAKLENVVRCDIFIKDVGDFTKVNEIYAEYFSSNPKPARQTVEVSALPKNALIEISCIACLG